MHCRLPRRSATAAGTQFCDLLSMVNRGEELLDIARQDVTIAAQKMRATVEGGVRAFADLVGVAVVDELPLQQRADDVHQRMMRDAITEGRGTDFSPLGVVDGETAVAARRLRSVAQFGLQSDQLAFEIVFIRGNRGMAALAPRGVFERQPQVEESIDVGIEAVVGCSHIRSETKNLCDCSRTLGK